MQRAMHPFHPGLAWLEFALCRALVSIRKRDHIDGNIDTIHLRIERTVVNGSRTLSRSFFRKEPFTFLP